MGSVRTDNSALITKFKTKEPEGRFARWVTALQGMQWDIEYRAGRSNANADFLSRHPVNVNAISAVTSSMPACSRLQRVSDVIVLLLHRLLAALHFLFTGSVARVRTVKASAAPVAV